MSRLLPLAASAALLCATAGGSVAGPTYDLQPTEVVATPHTVTLAGHPTRYTAELGEIPIRDVETGEPHGYIFYTAYRVPQPRGVRPRPVAFIWNGGPGADSTTLDFHVAGPTRVVDGRMVDNPQSWLAGADLVFVDPVGTGFSRPAKAEYAKEFYSTLGDIASVAEFVRAWRILHADEDAPLFLVGESWGAGRAGSVGYALQKRGVAIAGLVLISGGSGLEANRLPDELAQALRVPDYEETARFHGRLPPDDLGGSGATRRAAADFATRYAAALKTPAALSPAQRAAIIDQLHRFTGLPSDSIDPTTLRITPRAFRTGLLKAQGRTLNVFDMRRTDDGAEPADAPVILRFIRHDLGYDPDAPYLGLESPEDGYLPDGKSPASVGERWDYATQPMTPAQVAAAVTEAERTGAGPPRLGPPPPSVEALLALNPGVKVLVAAGRYDSLNSCTANDVLAARLTGALAKAMRFRCYGGGHMMYTDKAARQQLSADVLDLIAAAS